jgi:meso-butanediol dehydrogenase / (S,S)-butanediol dehydrogenase / diacetyl reductase
MAEQSRGTGRLAGKVAFITGATSGIGAIMARRFAEQGAAVVLAARREDKGEAIAAEIRSQGGRAAFHRMDQAREEDVRASIDFAAQTFGKLDVLVNNAGPVDLLQSGTDRRVHELATEGWDKIVRVTMTGPFWCCKYAIPHMLAAGGGSIVNISSIAAVTGLPMVPAYSAAKGGLSALTRSIAFDYGADNIRANGIITGLIVHEGSQGQVDTPEKYRAYRSRHLTRLGVPDDISNAAIYLASDESGFVTGSHIDVEGGVLVKSRPDAILIAGTDKK